MAKAKKDTATVEEKLDALHTLQTVDSEIDRIRIIRGELPLEVKDLEDETEGLQLHLQVLSVYVVEVPKPGHPCQQLLQLMVMVMFHSMQPMWHIICYPYLTMHR